MERILADFARAAWWAKRRTSSRLSGGVSRKLDKPAGRHRPVVRAPPGKSSLMDAVLALMPEEERSAATSAMTGQACSTWARPT